MRPDRMLAAALAAALAAIPRPASAWDSHCLHGTKGCEDGPDAAQHRWIDDPTLQRDEHRRIWLETLRLAGAPSSADDLFALTSFTASQATLQPGSFLAAQAKVVRVHSPSEFAQLPDFSYSLWDWALGNETCPIDGQPNALPFGNCHSFLLHMGPVNSNHFPPQTRTHYGRYHALALARAADCKLVRDRVGARADLQPFVAACVSEALVLEAIGHHFLQDSWSMGHMWQRWGSPNLADFPDVQSSLAVGTFSGLIHGARATFQGLVPGIDVDDALCAPSGEVAFVSKGGVAPGVGDIYWDELQGGQASTYAAQYAGMYGCAVGSVRAVLDAAGEPLQQPSIEPVDPATHGDDCFGRRATNRAMVAAYAIDWKDPLGAQNRIPLESLAAGLQLIDPTAVGVPAVGRLQFDAIRIAALLHLAAWKDPLGTSMAEGGMGTLAGVSPNGAYDVLGGYVDPPLPWPGAATDPAAHELVLARQFHRAHAKDWCDRFHAGDAELDLNRLRDRVTAAGAAREAACDVCAEFAERHLRVGDPATYLPGAADEPLCGLVATDPPSVQYVYQPPPAAGPPDRFSLARHFCGCGLAVSPTSTTLLLGGTQQFTATAQVGAATSVSWSATAGTIDSITGLFTAPAATGTVTVRATSQLDFAEAKVTVAGATLTVQESSHLNGPSPLTAMVKVPTSTGALVPAPGLLVELTPTCGTVDPASGQTSATGTFISVVAPLAGCAALGVDVTVRTGAGGLVLADRAVTSTIGSIDLNGRWTGYFGSEPADVTIVQGGSSVSGDYGGPSPITLRSSIGTLSGTLTAVSFADSGALDLTVTQTQRWAFGGSLQPCPGTFQGSSDAATNLIRGAGTVGDLMGTDCNSPTDNQGHPVLSPFGGVCLTRLPPGVPFVGGAYGDGLGATNVVVFQHASLLMINIALALPDVGNVVGGNFQASLSGATFSGTFATCFACGCQRPDRTRPISGTIGGGAISGQFTDPVLGPVLFSGTTLP